MVLAIVSFPRDLLAPLTLSRRQVIVGLVLLVSAGSVFMVAMPSYKRWDWVMSIWTFGLIPLTGIAGFLMQSSLRDPQRIIWWRGIASFVLFVLISFALGSWGTFVGVGTVIAFLIASSATGVAIVTGVWTAWSLPRWRKLTALMIGIVFPAAFFASIWVGASWSPESITKKNGDLIVQSLEQYYVENGVYPTELTELVPGYLTGLPKALTTQRTGWLYTSTINQYTLGYWHSPGSYGIVTLCLHQSRSKKWECKPTLHTRDWEPFSPVLTPIPTPKP